MSGSTTNTIYCAAGRSNAPENVLDRVVVQALSAAMAAARINARMFFPTAPLRLGAVAA
jgi:hypothetical protein